MEMCFHHAFIDTVHARRASPAGSQRNTGGFTQPRLVSNKSQESIELAFFVLRRPCRQFALHFTDYQRSSPHYGQLIGHTNNLKCLPSQCDRLSRSRNTTAAPPA